MEFRAAFRYIVVEKLFVQSTKSNCQIDFDKILLDLSCMTTHNDPHEPVVTPSQQQDDLHEKVGNVWLPGLPEQNVVAYYRVLAGQEFFTEL